MDQGQQSPNTELLARKMLAIFTAWIDDGSEVPLRPRDSFSIYEERRSPPDDCASLYAFVESTLPSGLFAISDEKSQEWLRKLPKLIAVWEEHHDGRRLQSEDILEGIIVNQLMMDTPLGLFLDLLAIAPDEVMSASPPYEQWQLLAKGFIDVVKKQLEITW